MASQRAWARGPYIPVQQAFIEAVSSHDLVAITAALDGGADIDYIYIDNTALHCATLDRHRDTMELLLTHGARVDVPNDYDETALFLACKHGLVREARLLLERRADPNVRKTYGRESPLHVACRSRNLHTEAIVRLLFEHGADINQCTGFGATPLCHIALRGLESCVRFLLERGAIVDARAWDGGTAMHAACRRGHTDVLRTLLEYGASTGISRLIDRDTSGTPIFEAFRKGRLPCVELLIDCGADKSDLFVKGSGPLRVAGSAALERVALEREFVWSPSTHHWVARKNHAFHRAIGTLLLLRNADDAAFAWLPNELMFEVFGVLFGLYQCRRRV